MQLIARQIATASVAGALTLALVGGTAFAQDASTTSNGALNTASDSGVGMTNAVAPGADPGQAFTGTPGSDALVGDANNNLLFDDQGGDDSLNDDQGGDDFLFDDEGNDLAQAGPGSDRVMLGVGDDRITGGAGDDELFGEEGDDEILGGEANDRIFGGDDDDNLRGEAGDDYLFAAGDFEFAGGDNVDGGPGNDTCVIDEDDQATGCENLITR